jgi:hypothetical protein
MAAAFALRGFISSFVARFLIANISTFLSFLCKRIYEFEGTMDVSG